MWEKGVGIYGTSGIPNNFPVNNQLLEIVMDNNIYYNIPNFEFKEQRNDMKLFNYDNNDISITNFPLNSYIHIIV